MRIRIPTALAHHSTAIGSTLLIGGLTVAASGHPASGPATILAVQGAVVLILGVKVHMGHPCTRCVAALPLNPAEAAERRRWAMTLTHRLCDRPRSHQHLAGAALFVAAIVLPAWALPLLAVGVVGGHLATEIHHRYAPWCPRCHPGGGGGGRGHNHPRTPAGPGGLALTH